MLSSVKGVRIILKRPTSIFVVCFTLTTAASPLVVHGSVSERQKGLRYRRCVQSSNKNGVQITVAYPVFAGGPEHLSTTLNQRIRQVVNRNIFIRPCPNCSKDAPRQYDCDYHVRMLNDKLLSLDFEFRNFVGGASGYSTHHAPFNCTLGPGVRERDLAFFVGHKVDYNQLSDLCKTKLYNSEIDSDEAHIETGAGPAPKNFSNFYFDNTGITFVFGAGQVAPYAIPGATLTFKYSELNGLITTPSPLSAFLPSGSKRNFGIDKTSRHKLLKSAKVRFIQNSDR